MTESDRALAPLAAVEASIEKLDTYRNPQELAESLQAIGQAVERSLRQLLRAETTAPDELRLIALSPDDLPHDRLILALRRHELISLPLAGMMHEMERVRARAASGAVRAADADSARDAVSHLRAELQGSGSMVRDASDDDASLREAAHNAVERGDLDEPPHAVRTSRRSMASRAVLPLLLLAVAALLVWAGAALLGRGSSDMREGIAAFEQQDMDEAEEKFRAALSDDPENVTARLYLARVLRIQRQPADAARILNEARKLAPDDADVLRELGHALIDMAQPAAAVAAYRRAQEVEPADPRNWVALVRALRAAGDPSADEVMRRAPAEAQATLRSGS